MLLKTKHRDKAPGRDRVKAQGKTLEAFLAKHSCGPVYTDVAASRLLAEYVRLQAEVKASYQRMDRIMDTLLSMDTAGRAYSVSRGRTAIIKDEFAEKNQIWRAHAARRYSIVIFGDEA